MNKKQQLAILFFSIAILLLFFSMTFDLFSRSLEINQLTREDSFGDNLATVQLKVLPSKGRYNGKG
jgi:hypothetical protein